MIWITLGEFRWSLGFTVILVIAMGKGGLGKSFGEMQMVFWGILVILKVLNDSYMISKNYGLFGNF